MYEYTAAYSNAGTRLRVISYGYAHTVLRGGGARAASTSNIPAGAIGSTAIRLLLVSLPNFWHYKTSADAADHRHVIVVPVYDESSSCYWL